MGKRIEVELPTGKRVSLYVSNNAKQRQAAAKKYSKMYGVDFDPNDLRKYAERERKYDQARNQQRAEINKSRPAWAKNIKNWASLTPAVRERARQQIVGKSKVSKPQRPAYAKNIKNWDSLTPAVQAKIARQKGYTNLKGDLYVVDNKGTLATKKAGDTLARLNTKRTTQQIQQQQSKPAPTVARQKTGFEKRVERVSRRQENINKRMKELDKAFDLSLYFGTAKTGAGRWIQKFASEALTLPTKFTVGAIDFLELSAEKLAATAEGLVVSRKNTLKELGRTAKETPAEVARAFDVRDPATAAQLTAILIGGVRLGKARALERATARAKPKPPKGQQTLQQSIKQIAKQNKVKTATLNKLSKIIKAAKKRVVAKSNKTNLDIARRENQLGRSLTRAEKRAVKKSLGSVNKAELGNLLKDIVKRERNLKRPLKQREIENIIKQKYEQRITRKPKPTPKPKFKRAKQVENKKQGQSMFKNKKAQTQLKLESTKLIETGKAVGERVARIGETAKRVRLPKRWILPIIATVAAEAVGLTQRPIVLPKPAQDTKQTPDYRQAQYIGQKPKQAQKQGQDQLQIPKSLLYSIAGTAAVATSLQRFRSGRRTPKPPKGGKKQSKQYNDFLFNKFIYSAKRNKKGIYLPDLYAVLNNEKATGKQKVKYLNPNTVFTGFEARPIIG